MGSRQRTIIEKINLSKLKHLFHWNGKGRPPFDRVALVSGLLLMWLFPSIQSYEDLEWFLCRNKFWARKCGFDTKKKTPDGTTFCKFLNSLDDRTLDIINAALVSELVRIGIIKGNAWSMDSTIIEAFPKDRDATWGYKDENTLMFGYKIHMIVCAESQLPLMTLVTPANESDFTWAIPLMSRTLTTFGNIPKYIIADKGYDSREIREYIQGICRSTKDIIPQREFTDLQPIYSANWKKIYKKRTTAERVWNIFKNLLNLGNLRVRGLQRVTRLVKFVCICVLIVALAAYYCGKVSDYRKIKNFKKII